MAAPTRAEIEAGVTRPTFAVERWTGSGWDALPTSYILKNGVSGSAESAGGDNGVTLGAEATARMTIRLDPQAASIAWARTRVRVRFGFAASDLVTRFTGIIIRRDRDGDGAVVWELAGFNELIGRTAIYSPLFYRRPAATLTSAVSVEDPTSPSYRAGLVNYILWMSGGRPSEQAATYPNATFYYRCDFSPITPEWSWAAGENAWEELGRLARACGMVIYQAADGTVTATSALALGGTASYTFTTSAFKGARETGTTGELVGTVRCAYTARRLQARQVVYEDTSPRVIKAGGTETYTLDMAQPVYDYEVTGGVLPSDTITATTTEGKILSPTAVVISQSAARLTITVTNSGDVHLVISRIQLRGRPITVVEEGSVSVGSGTPEREIGSDTGVYVQSQFHAERLCKLYYDLYGEVLPTRNLPNCGYDPDRSVGEIVALTYSPWSLSSAPHRITAIRHANTGATMEVDLVPASTLPTVAGTFIIGTTYSGSDTRLLSY